MPEKAEKNYKSMAIRGSLFAVGAQIFKLSLTFVSMVILSRLLSPEDFGLVACLAPIIAFITLFQDLGLQQAIIQKAEISSEQLNRAFWVLVAVGFVCTIILCLISPLVAMFYHDPRLMNLTIVASASLVLTSAASLPLSLLNRNLKFSSLAIIDCIANLCGFAAAIIGAWVGMKYWALILSPFCVALLSSIGAFGISKWRPGKPEIKLDQELIGFGANLTGFNVINFFARNLDNILIGRVQGPQELGFYDRAYKLLMLPLISLNQPLARVVIPILSRVQDDKERVRRIYLKIIGLVTLATVPGMAAALCVPREVILFLFGDQWLPVGPIFFWLCFAGLVQPLNSSSGWLFLSQGKAKEMFRWGLFSSATSIASFILGLHWGAVGVAAAYAISEYTVRLPCFYWYIGKIGPVTPRDFISLQAPLLAAAALTWGTTRLIAQSGAGPHGLPLLCVTVVLSYVLSFAILALFPQGRSVLREGYNLAAQALKFDVIASHMAVLKIKARMMLRKERPRHKLGDLLIVSLTSYLPRFATLHYTLQCLLTQTVKADKIILWVSPEDLEKIPLEVSALQTLGLEIRAYKNIGPYTKIIPTLQAFPESFVVTADDDLYYPSDWLEKLLNVWEGDAKEIICHRAHLITTDTTGKWRPYRQWSLEIAGPSQAPNIFPTGVGGILYPPNVFGRDINNEDLFQTLCPRADDVWLFWMARLNGARYRKTATTLKIVLWPNSQRVALNHENVLEDANDAKIKAVGEHYGWPSLQAF